MSKKPSGPEVGIQITLGGDYFGCVEVERDHGIVATMGASVLHMQGLSLTPQPVVGTQGVLLWNGEIFDGELTVDEGKSDTETLFSLLESIPDTCTELLPTLHQDILSKIEGPYAFIYYRKATHSLYYCRDIFGRRSLLRYQDENKMLLCSAMVSSDKLALEEVPVSCIFEISLQTSECRQIERQSPFPHTPLQTLFDSSWYDARCLELLRKAVKVRTLNNIKSNSVIAILFSGGLDSTLLARLADTVLDASISIELISVSFAHPSIESNTPDRISALRSFSELKALSPARRWIFSPVDVSLEQYKQHRPRILSLISPANTAMDLSIAAPFWFASTWPSKSRVLLVGFGADELFGGYSRYRARYDLHGLEGLANEIDMDLNRMWHRNLGRDDRVLSDGGREARYPFLDEKLVRFVTGECPITVRMDLNLPRGVGEKSMLRRIASSLCLSYCVDLPKRAVQFGTRASKMEGPGIKSGTDFVRP